VPPPPPPLTPPVPPIGANKFGMGVEMSEAYALCQFFKFALNEIYYARQAANDK
jgi:hypothetical protein